MTKTNIMATRVRPEQAGLCTLQVLRRELISPSFVRVTLGRGDIGQFVPMGYDQWFRLFIPVSEGSLSRLPRALDTISYLKYLAISRTERPVLRNYTVRAHRVTSDGPELDVDFVLHGEGAEAGPAAAWATDCAPGDLVAVLDEGITFTPPPDLRHALIVADETGLPAVAGILASLSEDFTGRAWVEVPTEEDRQELARPEGVELTWAVRQDPHDRPGAAVLAAAQAAPVPVGPCYCWSVGEQQVPTGMRRHWVQAGIPKNRITFTGYWKAPKGH